MNGLFLTRLFEAPWEYLAWILIVMFSICVHECAHAWVAVRCGDSTAAQLGHLTLNPIRQMGTRSILMLLIFGLTWGAVTSNLRNLGRRERLIVALTGPMTNLLLMLGFAAGSAALLRWWSHVHVDGAPWLLAYAARANATLALLNLLPLPALDGWGALEAVVPSLDDVARRLDVVPFWLTMIFIFFTPVATLVWISADRLAATVIAWLI